mmetsp:Transcript_5567/g.8649  ORF Transcript_5567/g.8649 Transcript_5567/m.8649 type:complete len:238 (+) Transcript_5567:22-735(+)|eukprot:CAMPEP_0203754714 /NCGR_PEP_ID=MMETSP0098-20131031/8278_1 /ASSEMBLY_ACC=CAM_ASM_000208 /TAXON_ID=96639 /ORGANISM=" , Strain NY0313808BC1" /LENGTH=237 /DNA_ID=CAMNT_0050645871 /DNA_START=58 /DNA_END=771 /DNA_ORIENTATION=-
MIQKINLNDESPVIMPHLSWQPHEKYIHQTPALAPSGTPGLEEPTLSSDIELAAWLSELEPCMHFFKMDKPNPAHQYKLYSPPISPGITSLEVFTSFVHVYIDHNGNRVVDCSQILSRDCFEKWLQTRTVYPSHPEECFRKSIISHITCSDGGSSPFPKEVEKGLLEIARRREVWACFRGGIDSVTGKPIKIGIKGLRSLGFHEKKCLERQGIDPETVKRKISQSARAIKRNKLAAQ